MSVIAIIIKAFFAFGDSDKIIITTSGSYIKEVRSSFTSLDTFAVKAFAVAIFVTVVFVVFVRHNSNIL